MMELEEDVSQEFGCKANFLPDGVRCYLLNHLIALGPLISPCTGNKLAFKV